jgi:carboxypeptidase T
MAHYHRNTAAGDQVTSMIDKATKKPITLTFDSVKDDFAALQKSLPGIVEAGVMGQSEQGADIQALRIGKNSAMPVLICGCHHAREWISVEVPFRFAKFLVDNYKTDRKIQRIVDSIELWVVPIVNPDGHERSVLKDRMWRKNFPSDKARSSVDINRNYEASTWKMKKGVFSDTAADDGYRGPSPGFAKEVVAMQDFIRLKKFKGVISYHSAGRFVLFPWAGKAVPPPDSREDEMATTLKTMIDSKGAAKSITYKKLQSSSLYPTLWGIPPDEGLLPGEFLDFVLETLPDCIGITIELEPDSEDPRGFVLPEDEIEPTFDLHRASMLAFLNCITTARKPVASVPLKLQKPGIPSPLFVFQPECWKVFQSY